MILQNVSTFPEDELEDDDDVGGAWTLVGGAIGSIIGVTIRSSGIV